MFSKTINQVRKISTTTLKSNPTFYGFLEHSPYEFTPVASIDQPKIVRHKYPERTTIDSSYRNPRHTNDRQQWHSKQTKLRPSDMEKGSRRKLHVFVPQYQAEKQDQSINEEFVSSREDSFKMSNRGSKSNNDEMKESQFSEKWTQEHGLQKEIDNSAFYVAKKEKQQQNMQQQNMQQQQNQGKSERDQEYSQNQNKNYSMNENQKQNNQQQQEQRETYSMVGEYQNKSQMQEKPEQQRAAFSESSKNRMFGNEEMAMKSDVKKETKENSSDKSQLSGFEKEIVEGRAGTYPNGQLLDEGEPQSWRGEEFQSPTASNSGKVMGKQGDGREEFKIPNDPTEEKKQYK